MNCSDIEWNYPCHRIFPGQLDYRKSRGRGGINASTLACGARIEKGGGSARPFKLDDEGQAAFNGAQLDL